MSNVSTRPDDWVICHRPNPQARLRLFCIPYSGSGTSIFRTWPNDFPAEIEVCAIRLPGRENRLREPPFTQLAPLTEILAQALRPYLDKPFAFFGHSVGALISFDVTRQLRRQGDPEPAYLFVSGRRAPQLPIPEPLAHMLSEVEFRERLHALNGVPESILHDPEMMELFLPTLRADFTIHETYIYTAEPPFNCPITIFGGLQDREASRAELDAWREHTRHRFKLRMLPGDHFFLHPEQSTLLQAIAQDLLGSLTD